MYVTVRTYVCIFTNHDSNVSKSGCGLEYKNSVSYDSDTVLFCNLERPFETQDYHLNEKEDNHKVVNIV